jgi:hypothetical protein
VAETAEVMIEGLDDLFGESLAGAMKIPRQFLLFRVHADHRIAHCPIFPPQLRDVLELRIAVGMMARANAH